MNISAIKNVFLHKDVEQIDEIRLSNLSNRYYENHQTMNKGEKKELFILIKKHADRMQYLISIWDKEMKLAGKVVPLVLLTCTATGFLFLHLNRF